MEKINFAVIIAAVISGIIGPLLMTIINNILGKQKNVNLQGHDRLIETAVEQHEIINEELETILVNTKADRVSIWQPHNGEKFYLSRLGINKLSKSFEKTAPGIASDQPNCQGLPMQMFMPILGSIKYNSMFLCYSLDQINDDSLRMYYEGKGIKSLYCFAIKSLDQQELIGILSMAYIKDHYDFSSSNLNFCKEAALKLTGYLKPIK